MFTTELELFVLFFVLLLVLLLQVYPDFSLAYCIMLRCKYLFTSNIYLFMYLFINYVFTYLLRLTVVFS